MFKQTTTDDDDDDNDEKIIKIEYKIKIKNRGTTESRENNKIWRQHCVCISNVVF